MSRVWEGGEERDEKGSLDSRSNISSFSGHQDAMARQPSRQFGLLVLWLSLLQDKHGVAWKVVSTEVLIAGKATVRERDIDAMWQKEPRAN